MGYFNFLPNILYRDEFGNSIVVKNIITRGQILDVLKESAASAADYRIRDGEKPETLAQRVYGRSDYHWLILLFNEIINPYFQWPLTMNEMEHHMNNVYLGSALFIHPNSMYDTDTKSSFDRRLPHLEVGDYIEQVNKLGQVLATGKVKSWDPDLYKIVVEKTSGKFDLIGAAAASKNIYIGDPSELDLDIRTRNRNGKIISFPLVRFVEDNKYAIHHFQKEDGEVISPHFKPTPTASMIDRFVLGKVEYFDLGVDSSGESLGYANIVTNIQYEEAKNDSKRKIKVMRPEYIDPVLRDFRRLFTTTA
jgi:hypothetical protein